MIFDEVISETEVNKVGTIFNRTLQYVAYADDVILATRSSQKLGTALHQQLEKVSEKVGLKINQVQT
jgi:hypothetical protein